MPKVGGTLSQPAMSDFQGMDKSKLGTYGTSTGEFEWKQQEQEQEQGKETTTGGKLERDTEFGWKDQGKFGWKDQGHHGGLMVDFSSDKSSWKKAPEFVHKMKKELPSGVQPELEFEEEEPLEAETVHPRPRACLSPASAATAALTGPRPLTPFVKEPEIVEDGGSHDYTLGAQCHTMREAAHIFNESEGWRSRAGKKAGEWKDKAVETAGILKTKITGKEDFGLSESTDDSKGIAVTMKEAVVDAAVAAKDMAMTAGSKVKEGAIAIGHKVTELTYGTKGDDTDTTSGDTDAGNLKDKSQEVKEEAAMRAEEWKDKTTDGTKGIATVVKEKLADAAHWTKDTAVAATHKASEVVWGVKSDLEKDAAKQSWKEGEYCDAASSGGKMMEAKGEQMKAKAHQL